VVDANSAASGNLLARRDCGQYLPLLASFLFEQSAHLQGSTPLGGLGGKEGKMRVVRKGGQSSPFSTHINIGFLRRAFRASVIT